MRRTVLRLLATSFLAGCAAPGVAVRAPTVLAGGETDTDFAPAAEVGPAPAAAPQLLGMAAARSQGGAPSPERGFFAELAAAPPLVLTAEHGSVPLPSGFHNPMPGGVMAGYRADTGLDLAGSPRRVFAIASGTLDYSEPGHTLWTGPRDTANTIRIELDQPIPHRGRRITHVWYAHLSELRVVQPEGAARRWRVEAGAELGVSGVANGSPHLHLGMLLDGDVSQSWGTYLLEDEVRAVLGGYRKGARLPAL